jgi:hypothetical protein
MSAIHNSSQDGRSASSPASPAKRIAARVTLALAVGILAGFGGLTSVAVGRTALTRATKAVTYVGAVDGSRALVGIARVSGRIRAYVCDSRHLAIWFDGTVKHGSVALSSRKHERLTARLDGHAATGTVTLADGRSHRFRATRATGRAGLYRGTAHGYRAGWIVLANKTQRGAIRDIGTGTLTPAPLLNSTALGDGRISITPIPIPSIGSFVLNFTSAGGLTH